MAPSISRGVWCLIDEDDEMILFPENGVCSNCILLMQWFLFSNDEVWTYCGRRHCRYHRLFLAVRGRARIPKQDTEIIGVLSNLSIGWLGREMKGDRTVGVGTHVRIFNKSVISHHR